jgi:hypothetical protein
MKTPLPPLIQSHLAEVAAIADNLAMTFDQDGMTESHGPVDMNVHAVLDNLDHVAGCLTWKELDHAPAMLNAAARAFRQTFPADRLGWEDAARLTLIAYAIERGQVDNYMKENPAAVADFYFKKENPFSTL